MIENTWLVIYLSSSWPWPWTWPSASPPGACPPPPCLCCAILLAVFCWGWSAPSSSHTWTEGSRGEMELEEKKFLMAGGWLARWGRGPLLSHTWGALSIRYSIWRTSKHICENIILKWHPYCLWKKYFCLLWNLIFSLGRMQKHKSAVYFVNV